MKYMNSFAVVVGLSTIFVRTSLSSEIEVTLSAIPTSKNQSSTLSNSLARSHGIVATDISMCGDCQVSGTVHANKNISLHGDVSLGGLITACSSILGTKNPTIINGSAKSYTFDSKIDVTGAKTTGVVPEFTDWPMLPLDYYRSIAQTNKRYYVGDVKWTASDIDEKAPGGIVPGGVVYVSGGSFEFTPNVPSITACIIAEKGIKWNAGNLIAPVGFPAMVVIEPVCHQIGIIEIAAGPTIKGLLYSANGSIKINGHVVIYGQMFAKDSITFGGTPSSIVYSNCIDSIFLGDKAQPKAIISAWMK